MRKMKGTVGIIGLGLMGYNMGVNLIKRGYTVYGYDIYEPSCTRFAEVGGIVVDSEASLGRVADRVIIMVFNGEQVRDVVARLSETLAPGGVVIVTASVGHIVLEELYPFPHDGLVAELQKYKALTEIIWVQDEPRNQGAWLQMVKPVYDCMQAGQKLSCSSRPASSSPAVGYFQKHLQQQKDLVEAAFGPVKQFVITR